MKCSLIQHIQYRDFVYKTENFELCEWLGTKYLTFKFCSSIYNWPMLFSLHIYIKKLRFGKIELKLWLGTFKKVGLLSCIWNVLIEFKLIEKFLFYLKYHGYILYVLHDYYTFYKGHKSFIRRRFFLSA